MQIEQITENKIRIILNSNDLQKNNIDLHSFMSNSPETQELFYNVLNKAEKEIGFKTKDYKLIVEALITPDGNFILTVTRTAPEKKYQKNLIAKRKSINLNSKLAIYMFNTFDEYIDFCEFIIKNYKNLNVPLKNSSLYLYNENYYFCLHINSKNINKFKSIHYLFVEFSSYINHSETFERKLKEHGKIIFANNAINNIIKKIL